MSAMVGALFLCGKDENLQPPKKAEINEKPLSAVGSRGRRVRGMPACRSISMPRRTRAPARSRVKSDIGIRQKRAKPRSCEAEMHQQGTSKTRSSDEGTPSGVSAGSCCPHHVAARRISKQLEEAQAVFFYACVSFFPQIFCCAKSLREPYCSLSHGVSSTTPPSCLRQDTSPYTGEASDQAQKKTRGDTGLLL